MTLDVPRSIFLDSSRGDWGTSIEHQQSYDFERLERAVNALVAEQENLRAENSLLRDQLEERDGRLHDQEERLRDLNQRRQDATKRIDELIAQVEVLADGCVRKAG